LLAKIGQHEKENKPVADGLEILKFVPLRGNDTVVRNGQ